MDLQANCGSISYSYDSLSSLSVSPHYVIIRLKQTQCPAALGGIDGATNTLGLDGGSVGYTGVTMENEGGVYFFGGVLAAVNFRKWIMAGKRPLSH